MGAGVYSIELYYILLSIIALFIYHPYIGTIYGISMIVVFIHEAGHLFIMRKCGYKNLRLKYYGFLFLAMGEKENPKRTQQLLMYIAGPLPGILFGILLYLINLVINSDYILLTSRLFIIINFSIYSHFFH